MCEDNLCDAVEIPIENPSWLDTLNDPGYFGLWHNVGAPASDVFSVKIPLGHRHTREVYGYINIEDHDGTSYDLYSRDVHHPQIITPQHNALTLHSPDGCPLSNNWKLARLCLKDRADDTLIVDQVLGFDKVTALDDYDRVKVLQLGNSSAFLTYATFSTAVFAFVEVKLIKRTHAPAAAADLYGTILAYCGNTYGHKYPAIMLFNQPFHQPITAVSDIPIHLSRNVVVVPAYSFLRIDLHLSDTKHQEFNGYVDILAYHDHYDEEVAVEAKDFVIQVTVQWCHPYQIQNHAENPTKRRKISNDQHLVPTLSREPFLRKHTLRPTELVEFFTVAVHHDDNNVVNIYGSMVIEDHFMVGSCQVFSRSETNPVTLSTNCNIIPIKGHCRSFHGAESLAMGLTLRDIQGRVFIQGALSWGYDGVTRPISWYDRRRCAVFRGLHGYATVCYTVFSEAVQALVKVSIISDCDPDDSHRLYGTIVARYSGNEYYEEHYSTEYEKTYYQSVLFMEAQGNSMELKSGSTVPLLKSLVAVPADASLIVDVNLYASSSTDENLKEHLKEAFGFGTLPGTYNAQHIKSKSYQVEVSVEWVDYGELCKSLPKYV